MTTDLLKRDDVVGSSGDPSWKFTAWTLESQKIVQSVIEIDDFQHILKVYRNPVALGIDSSSEYYCPLADNFEGPTQYAVTWALFRECHRCRTAPRMVSLRTDLERSRRFRVSKM